MFLSTWNKLARSTESKKCNQRKIVDAKKKKMEKKVIDVARHITRLDIKTKFAINVNYLFNSDYLRVDLH